MRNIFLFFNIILSLFFFSCTKDNIVDDNNNDDGNGSNVETLAIKKFLAKNGETIVEGIIDDEKKSIKILVPSDFDIKRVTVEVQYTEGAKLSPESGYAYNFSQPIDFTLSKDGFESVKYKVTVSTSPDILSFEVEAYNLVANIENNKIKLEFPFGVDLSNVKPIIKIPQGCTVEPASEVTVDMTTSIKYKVTNSSGDVKEYEVEVVSLSQEKQIRGVWVPDPSHTTVLHNYKNLTEFVDLLDELNFNAIYIATWVREQTLFKSQVLKDNSNYASVEDGWLLRGTNYTSSTNDPIKDLITLAHQKNIKVFFWFEYGFMRSGGANPSKNHPILSKHPDWDGINSNGTASNYNNTDYYLNSYDSEVQDFIISLFKESLKLYPEVDGVQGDDRLPAAPRNSGYNQKTKDLYKSETGKDVPDNYNDAAWVRWRLDKLNAFGKRLYDEVKAVNSNYLVSFSPNPYPWCEQNLMQDWPNWIKDGFVDFLSVQCYRDNKDSYRYTVNEVKKYVEQNTDKNILNPGIYLRTGNNWEELFKSQMMINRELGTNGEAFFYNEGLKNEVTQKVIKSFYTGKAIFPF